MTLAPQRILPDEPDVPALVRELYSRLPEARTLEPYELQGTLWLLRYTDELLDEGEIAAAIEAARTDLDPDEAAA
jgi:hypothetical protein